MKYNLHTTILLLPDNFFFNYMVCHRICKDNYFYHLRNLAEILFPLQIGDELQENVKMGLSFP